jgi:hypothetical protein
MNPAGSTGSRDRRATRRRGPGGPASGPIQEVAVAAALTAPLPLPGAGAGMLLATALPAAATAGAPDRISLTVRIDRALHARLRALAARQQRSHQDIVEGALDAYLNVFGAGCACIGDAKPKA